MDEKKLLEQLEALKVNLEGKTSKEIKAEIKVLEDKFNALIEEKAKKLIGEELKTFKDNLEAEYKEAIKVVQDHANALDVKMKGIKKTPNKIIDGVKSLITDNFEAISGVRKGKSIKVESKDMTLGGNLTGDQPRDYSNVVSMIPSQLMNVADLIAAITIDGGTYTFPREDTPTGTAGVQTEGADKDQIDYNLAMIDVNTDFIAGFSVYSKKMRNNLPFLESFLPNALRRDYWKAENAEFNGILATDATPSAQIITDQNKIEMLIAEIATLEGINYEANAIVVSPADYWDIMITEKSTGSGYGLPGVVTLQNGQLRINGIPLLRATWIIANKYYVGDWNTVKKVVTEGLGIEFSESDSDNFRKNNITARVEAQVGLAVEAPAALIYGDFTAV